MVNKKADWLRGLKDGLPICLGYFSVSIAFGMMAIAFHQSIGEAVLISLTNLTSAGQFAGLQIIAEHGGLIPLFISTLIINARYFLMALSVSQKMSEQTTLKEKLLVAYGITDEIFAVSMANQGAITFWYMLGVIPISMLGWVSGTWVGAVASSVLPAFVSGAFGIALYGMFIAILVPGAKKDKNVRVAVGLSIGISVFFSWISILSTGWNIILITVVVSAWMAFWYPINQEERDFEDGMERNTRNGSDDLCNSSKPVSTFQKQNKK